jgi:hypothetical protein
MPRKFNVKINQAGNPGPYTIYYNTVSPTTIAVKSGTTTPTSNLTVTELSTGNGVLVDVPDGASSIILRNSNSSVQSYCGNDRTFPVVTYSPKATVAQTNLSCFGGSNGTINVSNPRDGGPGRYDHSIDGTNWFSTFPYTYTNLTANAYTVRVRDGLNNVVTYPITLTQPTQMFATLVNNGGGQMTLSSAGGVFPKTLRLYIDRTSPYTTTGGDLISTDNLPSNTSVVKNGLSCGYYYLEVTDANGCIVNSGIVEYPCPNVTPSPTPTRTPTPTPTRTPTPTPSVTFRANTYAWTVNANDHPMGNYSLRYTNSDDIIVMVYEPEAELFATQTSEGVRYSLCAKNVTWWTRGFGQQISDPYYIDVTYSNCN